MRMNDLTVVDSIYLDAQQKGGCTAFVFFRVFARKT